MNRDSVEKKHRKKTDDNIIEEAIKLASKDPNIIV